MRRSLLTRILAGLLALLVVTPEVAFAQSSGSAGAVQLSDGSGGFTDDASLYFDSGTPQFRTGRMRIDATDQQPQLVKKLVTSQNNIGHTLTQYQAHVSGGGNMADSFGARIDFTLSDTDASNDVGRIAVQRSGADDTGKMTVSTMVSGTLGARITINADGTTSVAGALDAPSATINDRGTLSLREAVANGTNAVKLRAPSSMSADLTLDLPGTDGSADDVLTTNGSAVTSFAEAKAGKVKTSTVSGLPSAGTAGRMRYVTDGRRGLHLDTGSQWVKQGFINVKDFNAVGDGSTDDTTAIQNAITAATDAGGGTVYFPAGTYKVTSTLTVSSKGIRILGDGYRDITSNAGGSRIITNHATADVLVLSSTDSEVVIEKIAFATSTTRTAGAYIRASGSGSSSACFTNNPGLRVRDVLLSEPFDGIVIAAACVSYIQHVFIDRYQRYGIDGYDAAGGVEVDQVFMYATDTDAIGVRNASVTRSFIYTAGPHAIQFVCRNNRSISTDGLCEDLLIANNNLEAPKNTGITVSISVEPGGLLTLARIIGNSMQQPAWGIQIAGTTETGGSCGANDVATTVNGVTTCGVAAEMVIAGNTFSVLDDAEGGDAKCIDFDDTVNSIVDGNVCHVLDADTAYGFVVQSTSNNLVFGSNNVLNATTAQISSSSSTTRINGSYNFTFSTLPSAANGTAVYCTDCTYGASTGTCAGSGNGTFAHRINGAWKCLGGG